MVSQIFWSHIFTIIFEKKNEVNFLFYIGFIIILGSTILFSIFKLKKIDKKNTMQNISLINSSTRSKEF